MIDSDLTAVSERFSSSAHRYESNAIIQEEAAIQFDAWLAGMAKIPPEHIAEIGCGTGFLTRRLHTRYPRSRIHATDLAPDMVDHCCRAMPASANLQFMVCDGRNARFNPHPDWIVSTMCFQWFEPLEAILEHHLAQTRVLAFSILLDGSFTAWREAHQRLNLVPGLRRCPDYDQLLQSCQALGASRVHGKRIRVHQHLGDGRSFAQSLRAIGADQPRNGHKPINLRPVLRQLQNGFDANYEIGFIYIEH